MRVLITGAAGYLASGVEEILAAKGHTLRLTDLRDMKTPHEFVKADVRNPHALIPLMEGIDVVLHTAFFSQTAWLDVIKSGDSVETDIRIFDVNAAGTYSVLRAAQEAKVPRAVVITSEAARGQQVPITDYEVCDEMTPARPDYPYALTKYLQEVMCEYFTRCKGLKTICLRNGRFGSPYKTDLPGRPIPPVATGLLVQSDVTRNDMCRAAALAVEREGLEHEVFLLVNDTEFTRDEVPLLRTNPEQVIEKHYPGAVALLEEYGVSIQKLKERMALWKLDDNSKAKRLLGWRPSFTFRDFYENLKAGKYPKDYLFPF